MWRYRVVLFGPVTSELLMLTTSHRLERVLLEYEEWWASKGGSRVALSYAADIWAYEVEKVASSDSDSSLMRIHGPILQSVARSAREFEAAATRLAVEQASRGDVQAVGAEMQVAFIRMERALRELIAAVAVKLPGRDGVQPS